MESTYNTKVLLVDDEEEFLTTLAQRLETRNLKVSTAKSGVEAVDIVNAKDFDVIVLDLSMPGMDGLETLEKIKEEHPDAEIIMLTGHGSIETGIEAMKRGAEDFLEKPVDIKELMVKIEDAKQKRVLILQDKSNAEIQKILKSRSW